MMRGKVSYKRHRKHTAHSCVVGCKEWGGLIYGVSPNSQGMIIICLNGTGKIHS